MSSYDPTTVDIFYQFLVEDYCLVAAGAFYFYDILLTLDVEVDFFWKGPFTSATALFLANRYLALASLILDFFQLLPFRSDKSCALYERAGLALVYVQFLPPAVFSGLRAYALSKNLSLAVLILVLSLVPFGINMADFGFQLSGVVDPVFGCLTTDTESLSISMKFTIIARTCLITADILLIIITWARLYRKQIFSELSRPLTFERVLIQNGTLYFITLLIMNVLHLSFSLLSISGSGGGYSAVTAFTPAVTSVLISRFLLDLQRAKHKQHNMDNTSLTTLTFTNPSAMESMNFASRIMHSLGETLAGDTEVEAQGVEG
ncbi:hypothetical protein LXA43DRAFT_1009270 [Ganoderma leucocontextum]|nr:hypothetical protein LXA43DRAFT_1009270 [Ganoderma leucocontextum]